MFSPIVLAIRVLNTNAKHANLLAILWQSKSGKHAEPLYFVKVFVRVKLGKKTRKYSTVEGLQKNTTLYLIFWFLLHEWGPGYEKNIWAVRNYRYYYPNHHIWLVIQDRRWGVCTAITTSNSYVQRHLQKIRFLLIHAFQPRLSYWALSTTPRASRNVL